MAVPDRHYDPTKFDASRLMPPDPPGQALMDALNRTQALRAATVSRVTRMDWMGAASVRAGFPGPVSINAQDTIGGWSGLQAEARTTAERNGSALNSVAAGLRPMGITALTDPMPVTHTPRLPTFWDETPNATVHSALTAAGSTKAFDPIEATHAPGKAWELQAAKAIDAIERRLAPSCAWDTANTPLGPMIDFDPTPLPLREDLSAELGGLRRAATEAGEAIAADRRAQVERDEEMVRAMQAMEAALVESAEREAVSVKRAEEAEAREIAARARSEKLNARLVKLTVQLVILTCISVIAGVAAVIAVLT